MDASDAELNVYFRDEVVIALADSLLTPQIASLAVAFLPLRVRSGKVICLG